MTELIWEGKYVDGKKTAPLRVFLLLLTQLNKFLINAKLDRWKKAA